jgi:hypothetical protein
VKGRAYSVNTGLWGISSDVDAMVCYAWGLFVVYEFFGKNGRCLELNFRVKSCALRELGWLGFDDLSHFEK